MSLYWVESRVDPGGFCLRIDGRYGMFAKVVPTEEGLWEARSVLRPKSIMFPTEEAAKLWAELYVASIMPTLGSKRLAP